MSKREHFRDFHLLVLDHPRNPREAFREGPANIDVKIDYGKKAILKHTKPGDLILMEAPEKRTLENYIEGHRNRYWGLWDDERYKDSIRRELSDEWRAGENRKCNFYAELAEFAVEQGRKVVSLEPDSVKPGGRLIRLGGIHLGFLDLTSKISAAEMETSLLVAFGRTKSQIVRINNRKPRMVIASTPHGVIFEQTLRPRSVNWYKPITPEIRSQCIRDYERALAGINNLRKERRRRINERLMQEGKLPKTRARRQAKRRPSPK